MTDILHKRGKEEDLPKASPSELLYTTDSEKLFYGGTAQNIEVAVKSDINAVSAVLLEHLLSKSDPHDVTKEQVGLGNVNNTSDINKPVSTAQQTAINSMGSSTLASAKAYTDTAISGTVSPATLSSHTGNTTVHITSTERSNWNAKASTAIATTTTNGLFSKEDKAKLDGIAEGANKYVHPTGDGNLHVPATSTTNSGKVLKAGSTAGSLSWGTLAKSDVGLGNVDNTSDANKPVSTATQTALNAKASASDFSSHAGNTTIHITANERTAWNAKADTAVATTSTNGLFSSTDKAKLDGIAAGANSYVHPTGDGNLHVPATSTTNNGKVLKAGATAGSIAWGTLAKGDVGLGNVTNVAQASKTEFDTHVASTTLHVTATERTNWNAKYAKPSTGIPATDLTAAVQASLAKADAALNSAKSYMDAAIANLVDTAPEALNTLGELAAAIQAHESEYDALLATVGSKAPIASPALTGTPTAPTAASGTNTTQLATTAFVKTAVDAKTSVSGNAGTATKLGTARTITLSGDAAGSVSFDGSSNVTITTSLATITRTNPTTTAAPASGGTFTAIDSITTDAKGRVTSVNTKTVTLPTTQTTISGNAATATKLATARSINGKNFDGTANITFGTLYPDSIPASANLNNYKQPGMYYCSSNATAATLTNSPTVNAFSMVVESHAGTKQTITEYMVSGAKTYSRNMYQDAWSAWYRIHTTIDPQTTVSGNAGSATKLATARTVALSGDATGSASFDGSANATIAATLAAVTRTNNTSTASTADGGTFTAIDSITTDTKGRVTAVNTKTVTLPAAQTTVSGNAGSATKLATARTIALSGGATGTATSFDGSANITIPITALNPANLSSAVTVAKGGTGAATLASGQVLVGNGTSAVTTRAIDTTTGGTASSTSLITSGAVRAGLNLKANLASPTFTGTPAAPTAALNTNTTQVATTAFVQAAIDALRNEIIEVLAGNITS